MGLIAESCSGPQKGQDQLSGNKWADMRLILKCINKRGESKSCVFFFFFFFLTSQAGSSCPLKYSVWHTGLSQVQQWLTGVAQMLPNYSTTLWRMNYFVMIQWDFPKPDRQNVMASFYSGSQDTECQVVTPRKQWLGLLWLRVAYKWHLVRI